MKRVLTIFLFVTMLLSLLPTTNAEATVLAWEAVSVKANASAGSLVRMQEYEGKQYLFLPSAVSVEAVTLQYQLTQTPEVLVATGSASSVTVTDGTPLNLKALCGEENEIYSITLSAKKGAQSVSLALNIVPTSGAASMFLISSDPVNKGRTWVEASETKSNKATGALLMLDTEGKSVYDGKLKQIKGRGNSTWLQDKKPYQIKLDKKSDLLQSSDKKNAAKTWLLLANAADPSLLRNQITLDIARAMNMDPTVECRPVNLFYDGEYRGAYLLTEKVEIGSGRIDITDLEKQNEDANPEDMDFDALQTATGKTENGATYIYCKGMRAPEAINGGYLLEIDTEARAKAEKCYFITKRGFYVVVKSPEFCTESEIKYIATYYQNVEDALYAHDSNKLSALADLESFAKYYIVNEITKNPDSYRSSTFLYLDTDGKIVMSPVWDYDLSFGISWGPYVESCAQTSGFFALYHPICYQLYELPEFRQAVHELYLNTVSPAVTAMLENRSEGTPASFSAYCTELEKTAHADSLIWPAYNSNWTQKTADLQEYIRQRNVWLTDAFSKWNAETKEPISCYVDVAQDSWYFDNVMQATNLGLFHGVGTNIFQPDGLTTRAQTAQVLMRMANGEKAEFAEVFSDVHSYDWFADAVMWAYKSKVVYGFDDNTFHPDDPITRQDVVVLLYRFAGSPEVDGTQSEIFRDAHSITHYARAAVEWALENALLKGYEDNTLRPKEKITRAEIAALFVRYKTSVAGN